MPDLRARLAEAVQEHRRICGPKKWCDEQNCPGFISTLVRAVEKHISRCPHHPDGSGMIACEYCEQGWRPRPIPSREALEKIFREEGFCSDGEHQCYNRKAMNRLMAWATGKPKRWCEHITWRVGGKTHNYEGWFMDKPVKIHSVEHGVTDTLDLAINHPTSSQQWDFCPCCGTRRPE